jgi:GntR family transcriptional regulator of vanillate catabolism
MNDEKTSATHAQRALIALRQRILSGTAPGGTRLYEVALADDLEISRTPIRAALSQLAEEGLLDRAPSGGFLVRSFALADVVDTIELRGVLEGTAARFAAERGASDADLEGLDSLVAELDTCFAESPPSVDLEAYSSLNVRFHETLAGLAGSPVIEREIRRVTRLPFASPSAFLADRLHFDSFRRSLMPAQEQHRAMAEAIRRREGARAEAVAREHARAAIRNVEFIFAADPQLRTGLPGLALIAG